MLSRLSGLNYILPSASAITGAVFSSMAQLDIYLVIKYPGKQHKRRWDRIALRTVQLL